MRDERPHLSRRLARSFNRVRSRGLGEMLGLGLHRAREWWSSAEELIFFEREASPIASPSSGLSIRPATPDDASAYARDIGTDSPATFRARSSAGSHCVVVEEDGRLLHASWVTTSAAWTRELMAYVSPSPGDAYIYESFTRADARGRGLYPLALAGIVTWASEGEIRNVWVAAEAGNEPSSRAISKAGFVEAFRLPYRRRFGRVTRGAAVGPRASAAAELVRPP